MYEYFSKAVHLITGVPAMVPNLTVDDRTVDINEDIVSLTLSWGEPFNNLDPIVNYIVSCSGDNVTCPLNFTTTDNTTRNFEFTELMPGTNYTFSVVATNSIGSGEAGVLMFTTQPGEVAHMYICDPAKETNHVDTLIYFEKCHFECSLFTLLDSNGVRCSYIYQWHNETIAMYQ